MRLPQSITNLIQEFSKLPGIGQKTASRLAFYMLKKSDSEIALFSQALADLKKGVVFCSICGDMSESDPCLICQDPSRDHSLICVVEEPLDAQAIDATGTYKGLFHVLGGVLSPLEGIGPEKLSIGKLMDRLGGNQVKEVILALNPTLEGETTSLDLTQRIKPLGIRVTKLARGLPTGGDLEYADEITISNALKGRSET